MTPRASPSSVTSIPDVPELRTWAAAFGLLGLGLLDAWVCEATVRELVAVPRADVDEAGIETAGVDAEVEDAPGIEDAPASAVEDGAVEVAAPPPTDDGSCATPAGHCELPLENEPFAGKYVQSPAPWYEQVTMSPTGAEPVRGVPSLSAGAHWIDCRREGAAAALEARRTAKASEAEKGRMATWVLKTK
ncbi:hypothetical protein B0H15DRAFT_801117 [Mycena belliarum]|uniref:Uncharacterized protein n=1 Tax=Mycena belliarum TaxID=1033014 RepID=A0AAD6U382_9AGAR|nr:hypothetical protein B0H15DRAFT_801117 [Mycena belliae]